MQTLRKSFAFATLLLALVCAAPALAHGPQIQLTNDNNKITTRQLLLNEPYNTAPAPATDVTRIYVLPLAPITAFGGTEWFVQPSALFPVTDPGVAWGYGSAYTDVTHFTNAFPAGSNFVETMVGSLQQWNGTAFVTADHGAQLAGYRSSGTQAVSGSGTTSFAYSKITAPSAAASTLDPHGTAYWQLTGDGVIPSSTHVPAAVDDGIYIIQLTLSLANQPASDPNNFPAYSAANPIQDSDAFYFVLYKNVSASAAFDAANAFAAALAIPAAQIQATEPISIPEPASLSALVLGTLALIARRGTAASSHHR